MAATSYQFSLTIDFPNHVVNSDLLSQEIADSSVIEIALDHIDASGDDVFVWFVDQLPEPQQDALFNIVHAHTGQAQVPDVYVVPSSMLFLGSTSASGLTRCLTPIPVDVSESSVTVSALSKTATVIARFATTPGNLNQALWQAGEWLFKLWANASVSGSVRLVAKVIRVDSITGVKNTVFVSYAASTVGTLTSLFQISYNGPSSTGNPDDTLIVSILAKNTTDTAVDVTLYWGGIIHDSNVKAPLVCSVYEGNTLAKMFFSGVGNTILTTAEASPANKQTSYTATLPSTSLLHWGAGLWTFVINVASVTGAGGNLRVFVRGVDKVGTVTALFNVVSSEVVSGPGVVVIKAYVKGFPTLGTSGYSLRLSFTSSGEAITLVTGDNTSYVIAPIAQIGDTSGIVGPQGSVGFQGNQGYQGFQGFGFQGNQGNQGNAGPRGFQGFQGLIGSQGNQGFQGLTGSQGNQGFQGSNGADGVQGWQGFQGFQGNQGFQGAFPASAKLSTTAATSGSTETLIFKSAIAANSVAVGDTFEITVFGISSSTGTLIFRVRVGANGTTSDTQAWVSITSAAQVANQRSGFNGLLVVRSIGSSGTIQCECVGYAQAANLPTVVAAVTTPTVNTTATWNIDITCTCSSGTWTAQSALISKR